MKKKYVMAIDQGTTGSTVLVVECTDKKMLLISKATVEFPQHYPQAGWVSHDLEEVWISVRKAAEEAFTKAREIASFDPKELICIGITNQRESTALFERKTGRPATPSIVWQCKRSLEICQQWKTDGWEDEIRSRTGLRLDPYFSGSKIKWMLEKVGGAKTGVENGSLVFGTMDSFILHRLTGCVSFATDASNASRTLLLDLTGDDYAADTLQKVGLRSSTALPEIKDSAGLFGVTKGLGWIPDGVPITGILGDQQAAMMGQYCFEPGEAKCTYGTGAFLLTNIGSEPSASKSGMLTTIAWQIRGKRSYALEGAAFIAGAAIQFLRDQLGLLKTARETTKLIENVEAAPQIYFVPALAGLGVPYWDPNTRGAFFGLTRDSTKEQILRAAVEGIAFQVDDLIRACNQDSAVPLKTLRADGGAVVNTALMQFQSDISKIKVEVPKNLETTAMGAAMIAALGVGFYESTSEMRQSFDLDIAYAPRVQTLSKSQSLRSGWDRAIEAARLFARQEA